MEVDCDADSTTPENSSSVAPATAPAPPAPTTTTTTHLVTTNSDDSVDSTTTTGVPDSGSSSSAPPAPEPKSQLTLEHSFVKVTTATATPAPGGPGGPGPLKPSRFSQVPGFEGRKSDVFYLPPAAAAPAPDINSSPNANSHGNAPKKPKLLIYFGGDIQEAPEIMELGPEPRKFLEYNLERTTASLSAQFPGSHVLVFRPTRMENGTFSNWSAFVPVANERGDPEFVMNHNGLRHLEEVLKSLEQLMKGAAAAVEPEAAAAPAPAVLVEEGELPGSSPSPSLNRMDISLVGFSKGCVVLNQFLYEFHYLKTLTPDDKRLDPFLASLTDIYWLDGGHSGGKNTWLTARSLLETLVRLHLRIHVHLTPYQIRDHRRPWIRKEEKVFSESIKKFGGTIQRFVHFGNESGSLENHFRLIGCFSKVMESGGGGGGGNIGNGAGGAGGGTGSAGSGGANNGLLDTLDDDYDYNLAARRHFMLGGGSGGSSHGGASSGGTTGGFMLMDEMDEEEDEDDLY